MGVTERGFTGIDVDVILENCTVTFVIPGTYLTKDQHRPSNLVVYSTIQCSTVIEITIRYHK